MNKVALYAPMLFLACFACGGSPSKFPARAKGCDVEVMEKAPTVATEDVGVVRARCGDTVSEADCLRELMDQACGIGADIVWGVQDKTSKQPFGRAAKKK